MDCFFCLALLFGDRFGFAQAPPGLLGPNYTQRINRRLHGQILDFTKRPGRDHRLWSPALNQPRDLLVYLPPGYDASKRYPLILFLHGAGQDEQFFLQAMVRLFDQAIASGQMPPAILAAPDGSIHGRAMMIHPASFWADSRAGRFHQYVMTDVWDFLTTRFAVRPEREAKAIVGVSMGGSAAFALALEHRDRFGTAIGLHPLLNLRYVDCQGKYHTPFDPACVGQREQMRAWEKLGRRGLFCLRFNDLFVPMYGRGADAVAGMSSINPLELMERTNLRAGEIHLHAAYGAKDEFNVAAQVESFLHVAGRRGIEVSAERDAEGKHDFATILRLLPGVYERLTKSFEVHGTSTTLPVSVPAPPSVFSSSKR